MAQTWHKQCCAIRFRHSNDSVRLTCSSVLGEMAGYTQRDTLISATLSTTMHAPIPQRQQLVLAGGGHSHVGVIRSLGMRPLAGVGVTVVNDSALTPYSGMLPGLIAGHYQADECFIDLRRLCEWAGCRFIEARIDGLDTSAQQLQLAGRPAISYDYLAINAGSTPALDTIPGAAEHGVGLKPINTFLARFDAFIANLEPRQPATVTLVGGGAAGVEVVLAMQHRLQQERPGNAIDFHLLSATSELLPSHNRRVQAYFTRLLASRGIELQLNCKVHSAGAGQLQLHDGRSMKSDFTAWAIHAGPQAWFEEGGLNCDEHGFIQVKDTLQSTSCDTVFATGDCAAFASPLPKSGVYAVRQGPILAANLSAIISAKPLQAYKPQHRFLSLMATGDKHAVASRGSLYGQGRWLWRLKNRIDQAFIRKFTVLPSDMADTESDQPDDEMRCGGCGAKVGSQSLTRALQRINASDQSCAIGPEDAAIFTPPVGKQLVQTVDFFRAFIDDPYLVGRIGANHCLGDVYAMGAEPVSALATVTIPYAREKIMEETLYQLMAGALSCLRQETTELLGGHSGEGAELGFGLAVNGLLEPGSALPKQVPAGDYQLVLGKPLGTGTLMAANMRAKARGQWVESALHCMEQSNRAAAAIMRAHQAAACTDITGFGLLGHLLEMLGNTTGARLNLAAIPTLDGAIEAMNQGISSSLQDDNARLANALVSAREHSNQPAYPMLFDPQTAGGLLAAIPNQHGDECLAQLRQAGYEAAIIGGVSDGLAAGQVELY